MGSVDINEKVEWLNAYKGALEENVDLSVTEFCRERDITPNSFLGWLQRNGILVVDIKNEVRGKLGMPLLPKDLASQYSMVLEEYRMRLSFSPDLSVAAFCDESYVNSTAFRKWMRRNGYTVASIRKDVLGEVPTIKRHISKEDFGTDAKKRFESVLEGFKKHLHKHKNAKLKEYCKAKGVDYPLMQRWMRLNGVSEKQIRIAERIRRANEASPITNMLPINPDNVFVQFKPNGGTDGDRLKGVTIRFPDGKLLQVEECTVVSLCSFINIYDKNQR